MAQACRSSRSFQPRLHSRGNRSARGIPVAPFVSTPPAKVKVGRREGAGAARLGAGVPILLPGRSSIQRRGRPPLPRPAQPGPLPLFPICCPKAARPPVRIVWKVKGEAITLVFKRKQQRKRHKTPRGFITHKHAGRTKASPCAPVKECVRVCECARAFPRDQISAGVR